MIYFLYDVEDRNPYINEVGEYSSCLIGAIDEANLLYIRLPKVLIVPKNVAMAWKFAGKYKGYINVREKTRAYDQIDHKYLNPYKDKYQYSLTEEDKENACLFQKAFMCFTLNKYYKNKIRISNSTPAFLRDENWSSEHVLLEKKKIVESEINACQNWIETGILLDKKFGVQYDPNIASQTINL